MPRHDRGVAQRYASKKRRKRAAPDRAPAAVGRPARVEPAESLEGDEAETPPPPPPTPARTRPAFRITTGTAAVAQGVAPRRTFESYADEYRYVGRDLRRVAVVAGGLLLVLIILSFFISSRQGGGSPLWQHEPPRPRAAVPREVDAARP